MRLPLTIILLFNLGLLFSFEDLGPLQDAKKKYPQIFEIGSVKTITINKVACYCFSGQAEQSFKDEFATADSELYEEATLVAKSNLFTFLSNGDKKVNISFFGNKVLYQYNDKKIYTVILFVPIANIKITKLQSNTENSKPITLKLPQDIIKQITPKKNLAK